MSYQVLYRKFRPKTFSDVLGQEHITTILRNQIQTGKISHAYLFTGSKGTGKTSTAKIFARTVNCLHPKDGQACGKCAYCKSLEENALSNIIEIDAASNRGIDEIRELRENVNYLPIGAKYRVYIIDEVHMLTTEAFNALLKTLEEPPEHIIFIFATTEVNKILPTILSRTQRFDFKRISVETIISRLQYVLNELDIPYEKEALLSIADRSDGALRDALSFLDKAISAKTGEVLTEKDVAKSLGLAGEKSIITLAQSIIEENTQLALEEVDSLFNEGCDTSTIQSQLLEYYRALLIFTYTANPERILNKSENYLESLLKMKQLLDENALSFFLSEISKIRMEIKYAQNPRYILEMCILRLINHKKILEITELNGRIANLEKKVEGLTKKINGMDISSIRELALKSIPKQPETVHSDTENKDKRLEEPPIPQKETKPRKKQNILPHTDDKTLAKIQKELQFAGGFIHNKERNIILSDIYQALKVAAADDTTIYVYPTGNAKNMMDLFDIKNGKEKLETILTDRLKREITVEIIEKPANAPSQKASSALEEALKNFGDLTEIE